MTWDTKFMAGFLLLGMDIFWMYFYFYAAVKVYNLKERGKYGYVGCLWIGKKRGELYLRIPPKIICQSVTTEYKIESVSSFHRQRQGETLHIDFGGKYQIQTRMAAGIIVKNYIATSQRL